MSKWEIMLPLRLVHVNAMLAMVEASSAYLRARDTLADAEGAAENAVQALRDAAKGDPALEAETFAMRQEFRTIAEMTW